MRIYKHKSSEKMKAVQEIVMNNLQKSQLKNKAYHTKKTKNHTFDLGDYVWLRNRK